MKRKAILGLLVLVAASLILVTSIDAAKPRVRKPKTVGSTGIAYSSAKLSRPTNSLVVNFLNQNLITKADYVLSYTANGISQGAVGSFAPGQTTTRDLYFGTCSKNVCTPHTNIKNAQLLVTTSLKSGGKHVKRYRIKV